MPFGLLRTGASLLGGPFAWIAGAAVVALVITGLTMVRNSGYAAAETHNLRAVAQAERQAGEKLAADLDWLQHRQGRARDTEEELRREVDLWRERARERDAALMERLTTAKPDASGEKPQPFDPYCRPGCLERGE